MATRVPGAAIPKKSDPLLLMPLLLQAFRDKMAEPDYRRPSVLSDDFNPYDPHTWGCIEVDDKATRNLASRGAFHIKDLGGRLQGWWANAKASLLTT